MSNERETIADIVAEMRREKRLEKRLKRVNVEGFCISTYADRIEAAWEREAKEIYVNAAPLPCVLLKNGNAAAMREALVELMQFTCNSCQERFCESDCEEEDGQCVPVPCSAILKARAALAEPVRNCDLPNPEERYREFCSRYQSCSTCPHNRTLNGLRCDGKWLLAPATDRKGATA